MNWSETITSFATTIKKQHIDELRSNVNTVRSWVNLGAYNWTKNPIVQYETIVEDDEWNEIRTALDQADTANVCSVDKVTHYSSHNGTHYVSNKEAHYVDNYSSIYVTDYTDDHSYEFHGHYSYHYDGFYQGNNWTQNSSVTPP